MRSEAIGVTVALEDMAGSMRGTLRRKMFR
jgi:hypothetical protein